jgi:outer membrane protein OmpA-like peptidoglycan-associated protein
MMVNDQSETGKGNYSLNIIETGSMNEEITSSEMFDAFRDSGKFIMYVFFDAATGSISDASTGVIDHLTELMRNNPSFKISIEAHTDSGDFKTNKLISEKRASAIASALIGRGIERSRMTTKGWGQEKPVADNESREGRARNTRIEIIKQ